MPFTIGMSVFSGCYSFCGQGKLSPRLLAFERDFVRDPLTASNQSADLTYFPSHTSTQGVGGCVFTFLMPLSPPNLENQVVFLAANGSFVSLRFRILALSR
jgi:hypothetical protein